ncbi:hypothetical protein [Haloplanus natans]|uniref:hypothetical protein n=1 Tax=Haloplanus natans TaxID=376171 RepID=UPI00067816E8|nr:hypothetical protein [Haloplanus natans]
MVDEDGVEQIEEVEEYAKSKLADKLDYCSKTGEVHRYDDFDRFSLWTLIGRRPCRACGEKYSNGQIRSSRPIEKVLEKIEELKKSAERGFPDKVTNARELAQCPEYEDDWVHDLGWSERRRYRNAKKILSYDSFVDSDSREEREELTAMRFDDKSMAEVGDIVDIAEILLEERDNQ